MAYGKFLRLYCNFLIDFISVTHCIKKAIIWKGKVFVQDCKEDREREGGGTDGADSESDPQSTVTFFPKTQPTLPKLNV